MKDFDQNSSWSSESLVRSDVWSAKNRLFMDYTDTSQGGHLPTNYVDFKRQRQLGQSDNIVGQAEQTDMSEWSKNIFSAVEHILSTPTEDQSDSSRTTHNSTCKARLSPSCSPLDISAARYNEAANDSLLKTPAGFYDRCLPFSGPSIPPLFERDESNFCDALKSCCTSSASSVTSSSDDLGSTCSTRCSSPSSISDQGSLIAANDESRFCDRLVCSVLSQIISDDFCSDACLLNSIGDIEDDVESNRSNACSPNSSSLNPLAPAFRIKPGTASSTLETTNTGNKQPPVAVRSPVQLAYVQQHVPNPLAWSYVPAYYSSRQSSSRKTRPGVMHYTPLCGKLSP